MSLFIKGFVQIIVGMMWSVTLIFIAKGTAMIMRGFGNIMAAFTGAAIKGTAKVSVVAGKAAGEAIGKGISKMRDQNESNNLAEEQKHEYPRDKLPDDREIR